MDSFRERFQGADLRRYVRNVDTKLDWVQAEDTWLPITRNSQELDCSYVVSPYAALILYSRQEMRKVPKAMHFLLLLLHPLSFMLKRMRLNEHVALNNWLLSTNLYPPAKDEEVLARAREAVRDNPESFVLLRSLNERTNGALISRLKQHGFDFLPSRQVYFFDFNDASIEQRHNYAVDQKLLAKSKLEIVPGGDFGDAEFRRAEKLYDLLYLDKYSEYNPAYTAEFLKLCRDTGTMVFHGLRDSQSGELQVVVGFFIVGNVLTAPIVGYNTGWPSSAGLYRQAIALTLKYAKEHGHLVNLSSGASGFKRLRGGKPVTEWSAVYVRHLSWPRRMGFRVLQGLLVVIVLPLLKVFKL